MPSSAKAQGEGGARGCQAVLADQSAQGDLGSDIFRPPLGCNSSSLKNGVYFWEVHVISVGGQLVPYIYIINMGGCQNYGPLLGPLNTRCRILLRNRNGVLGCSRDLVSRLGNGPCGASYGFLWGLIGDTK